MVEFDSDREETINANLAFVQSKSPKVIIETDPKKQASFWHIRESMLLHIMNFLQSEEQSFPPFADDIAVPPRRLAEFITEIQSLLSTTKTSALIYGHAGEGNLHIRPLIKKDNWQEKIRLLADLFFSTALKYNGTISGEHGCGRNRSKYLRVEWGDKIYGYFQEIKNIFDPLNRLNPEVMFNEDDLTKNLQF